MIGSLNLTATARNPKARRETLRVRAGSAATVALNGVPAGSGVEIASVAVRVVNPAGQAIDVAAVRGGGAWAFDVPASHLAAPGTVEDGVLVYATGTGVSGERTWFVGAADLEVCPADGAVPSPGAVYCTLRLHEATPSAPARGDCYVSGGMLYVYDGAAWIAVGGGALPKSVEGVYDIEWDEAAQGGEGLRLRMLGGDGEWRDYIFLPPGIEASNAVARVDELAYSREMEEPADDGSALWLQLQDRACLAVGLGGPEFSGTLNLLMPPAVEGRLRDLLLDVKNDSNDMDAAIEFPEWGESVVIGFEPGADLSEMFTVAPGTMARFYFSECAMQFIVGEDPQSGAPVYLPLIMVHRLDVTSMQP